jgi:transketolase
MTVVEPADAVETEQVVRFAADHDGPMYIRVGRDPRPRLVPEGYDFQLGKSATLKNGKDVTLIACGDLLEDTLAAGNSLKEDGIDARVINMSTIKPIDDDAIVRAARETGGIVTVDNHNIYGGLGSAVAEVVCEKAPVRVKRIGVRDVFGKSGTNPQMQERFGLRAEDIKREVVEFLEN